jgi:hypothetical protein
MSYTKSKGRIFKVSKLSSNQLHHTCLSYTGMFCGNIMLSYKKNDRKR